MPLWCHYDVIMMLDTEIETNTNEDLLLALLASEGHAISRDTARDVINALQPAINTKELQPGQRCGCEPF